MKYVPSLPPVATTVENWREVQALAAARRVRPAAESARVVVSHPHHQEVEPVPEVERREQEHESRRKICRRIHHQPVLEELRSGVERRKGRQRDGDDIDHIDEEA